MKTSDGTFAMTDGGANVSTSITDKFRVGAQFYIRNIGELGNFRPELDWGYGDYRFASWLGVRAGKVKSAIGLHNDTQDLEFLHTWAILPQSAYPLDLRASTIAHTGGDLYGEVKLNKQATVSYTLYGGSRPDDPNGGYRYGTAAFGINLSSTNGTQLGGDVRLNNAIEGLILGGSFLKCAMGALGTMAVAPNVTWSSHVDGSERTTVFYAQYKRNGLTVEGEYRRAILDAANTVGSMPARGTRLDARGWWSSVAYRVHRRLELGTYHSRYYPNWALAYRGDPAGHMFDQAVTARVDLYEPLGCEGGRALRGWIRQPVIFPWFLSATEPAGLQPETHMLVIRTGWNF